MKPKRQLWRNISSLKTVTRTGELGSTEKCNEVLKGERRSQADSRSQRPKHHVWLQLKVHDTPIMAIKLVRSHKTDKRLSVNFVVPVSYSEEIQGWIILFIFTLGHTKSLSRENLPRIADCADCVTFFLPMCPRRNMTFFSFPVVFAWRGKRPLRVCGLSSDKTIRTCLHEDDPGMFKDAFVWSDDEVEFLLSRVNDHKTSIIDRAWTGRLCASNT